MKSILNTMKLRIFLGPVFVEFPIDVLYPFHLVEREVGIKPNAKTFADRLANLLVERQKSEC
jgi:hypothetical protein